MSDTPRHDATRRSRRRCAELFGEPDVVVRSPGRVNLIGDHTDYNDGLAMPMAIDLHLGLSAVPTHDRVLRLWSELDDEVHEFGLDEVSEDRWPGWTAYVQGILRLDDSGPPTRGFDLAIASDLPEGAGLSSSAALELGVARVVTALEERPWLPDRAAALGRRAENEWVGVSTGIMDQLTVAHASEGAALLVDFADESWRDVVLPDELEVVVLDTGARRSLVGSAYDDRRADCVRAAAELGVESLRLLEDDWERRPEAAALTERLRARVRHVVSETARVREFGAALEAGDVDRIGVLLSASHASLRDDYEVSGPELDTMAAIADETRGIVGARMTGGGFAGACVAIARTGAADLDGLIGRYRAVHNLPARALPVSPAAGTAVVDGGGSTSPPGPS